jgi:hypothetical protein
MEYINLSENGELPEIGKLAPFKVVLAIEDPVDSTRRRQITRWLVEAGALYVMICGSDCDDWQEAIRRANLAQVSLERMQPQEFVMITTHPHERLRGIYRYARKHAKHTHVRLDNIVTVHLARRNREVEYKNLFNKS